MKRKIFIGILAVVFLIISSSWVMALAADKMDNPGILDTQMENIDIAEMQQLLNSLNQEVKGYIPELNAGDMIKALARGKMDISAGQIISGIGRYLFAQVLANINLLVKLLVLAIIYAVLRNIQNSFGNGVTGELAQIVCMLVLIAIAVQSFSVAVDIGSSVIDKMVLFMQALLPVLLALLVAMGGITSMALLQPVIAVSIGVISTFLKDVLLPVIFFSAVLAIINNISEKFHLSRLASLLKQGCIAVLGLVLTVFTGIMSIQGVTASTIDGVSIRTAKFAVDSFVPVVGGLLSDTVDTIMGCSLLVKNAVGAFGLISLFVIVAFPVLKIISLVLVYKICAAVIEPIAQGPLVKCLNDMSNSLLLLFAAVISVAVMFFISVTIIIGAGNATLMMR